MYKSLKINNFRCFESFSIDKLARINLIVGKNNVGKTALLEALFLHCGAYNPELAFRVNAFRGIESIKVELTGWAETPWDSLFYNFDSNRVIEITGENSTSGTKKLKIKIPRKPAELKRISYFLSKHEPKIKEEADVYKSGLWQVETAKILEFTFEQKNTIRTSYLILDQRGARIFPFPVPPPFPAFFQASKIKIPFKEEAERFGKLELNGKQNLLLDVLKIIEPRLKRLLILVMGGEPIIHGDLGESQPIPLPLMGEGMVKLTNIILHIANASNGVVLIDEIDNGLHHSVLKSVWKAIAEAAHAFNTQIFASTHSMDCIIAAHEAFSESKAYDFRLHRLEWREGKIITISYDKKILDAAINSELEVR
ncbi:MAG: AAA family ATPase [Candidatus Aminicenantes bacterium]|nr:AAA family ATPase [Candidatus Aminicenantes bacterium]